MDNQKRQLITVVIAVILIFVAFAGGIQLGYRGESLTSKNTVQQVIQGSGAANQPVSYQPLWTVLQDLQTNYIDSSSINAQNEMYGAIQGAVASLGDPYTVFFNPQQYSDFETQLGGSVQGIGAEVAEQNNLPTIVSTIAGSPARAAGLAAGDEILKVNGTDVTTQSLDAVVADIRGNAGTTVTITIFRPSANKQMDFTITRAQINIQSVTYGVKTLSDGKKVEDITIAEFGDNTISGFATAEQDAIKNNVSGIIVDLRDDGGGYLDSAVNVASYWLQPGQLVVSEAHPDGSVTPHDASGNDPLHDIPTVVLVNGGTASASEILSGALRDQVGAKLIGEKTFGKGSVQTIITDGLPAGTGLKVTIAKWLTPKGVNLNHNGLDPDVTVDLTAQNITDKVDPQMDAALSTLQSEIK